MSATPIVTPTRSAPNADPATIAAILARSLPAGHPYIYVDADPLARLVPLSDEQLATLTAERLATEEREYERLTRRARRHPNGIKSYKARAARNQASMVAWSQWKEAAYFMRRVNAEALVAAAAAGETRTPLCPSCGEELVGPGNWAGGSDYLCDGCYAGYELDMAAMVAAMVAAEVSVAA